MHEAEVLTHIHPSAPQFASRSPPYVPRPYSVRVLMRLSGAQSPFARSGRYPSRRDFQNLVGRHYPAFLAPTDSCADPKPSSCLGKPSYTRSLQVAVSPCWESDLPGVSSANLCSRAWTPTPAALVVHSPVSSHKTTAFPTLGPGRRDRSRDHSNTPTAISVGNLFRGCSHSLMFRPVSLLATPIAPTAVRRCSGRSRMSVGFGGCPIAFALALSPTPIDLLNSRQRTGQPWLLRPRLSRFVTSPSRGYANRPFRATDGRGTCTLLDSQPCRLLP
jgi:hypothetical protein